MAMQEEEKAGSKEDEVTEETVLVDKKETIPVLKPSVKADESEAVNAIQVNLNLPFPKIFLPSYQQ